MKHKLKITIIILLMFLLTQFIGLYVANYYSSEKVDSNGIIQNVQAPHLPYGLNTPNQEQGDFEKFFSILISFVIALSLIFLLTKYNSEIIIKLWFFIVVIMALGISFSSFIPANLKYSSYVILIIAILLSYFKTYKRNLLVHNFTELFIYPGIAAVFIPLLNIYTIVSLLILISAYDIWAVWHSGIMQKMAKFQIENVGIFSGFFIPYASKSIKAKIKKMKATLSKSKLKKKKLRVNVAILGGGDVVFPIITAGVILKTIGLIPSFFVVFGAVSGLAYLLFFSEKKQFYPAMPFITIGMFLGIIIGYFWVLF